LGAIAALKGPPRFSFSKMSDQKSERRMVDHGSWGRSFADQDPKCGKLLANERLELTAIDDKESKG